MAHKDSKLKRKEIMKMFVEKQHAKDEEMDNPKAMEKFKAIPYQIQYKKRMREYERTNKL